VRGAHPTKLASRKDCLKEYLKTVSAPLALTPKYLSVQRLFSGKKLTRLLWQFCRHELKMSFSDLFEKTKESELTKFLAV
jgi:hypothetical protein